MILLAVLAAWDSYAQNLAPMQEAANVKVFGINEFGYSIFVNDILEDSNGSMLLASTSGLWVMNSKSLGLYYTESNAGLTKLKIDKKNNVFVIGHSDIGYFVPLENGRLQYVSLKEDVDLKTEEFFDIQIVDDLVCYIGKHNVYVFDYQSLKKVDVGDLVNSFQFAGKTYLLSKHGLVLSFDGRHTKPVIDISPLKLRISNLKFLPYSDSSMFIGDEVTLYKTSAKSFSSDNIDDLSNFKLLWHIDSGNYDTKFSDLVYDKELDLIAISSNKGIWVVTLKGKHMHTLNYYAGLPHNDVRNLYFDSRHNLWAALSDCVVKIELNSSCVSYSNHQGIQDAALSFAHLGDDYYCGSFNHINKAKLFHDNDDHTVFEAVKYDNSLGDNPCWNIQELYGHVLACTSDGLYELNGLTANKLLDIGKVYYFAVSKLLPGKLLISSVKGLYIVDCQVIKNKLVFGEPRIVEGLNFPLWSVKVADNGTIWLSSLFDGIFYVNPKDPELKRFSLVNIGKNHGFELTRQMRFDVYGDNIAIYANNRFLSKIPKNKDFVSSDLVFSCDTSLANVIGSYYNVFGLDTLGNLFISGYSEYMYAKYVDGSYKIDTVVFNENLHTIYSIYKHDSLLYVCSDIGLMKYNLNSKSSHQPQKNPFNVLINEISVNGNQIFQGLKYFEEGKPRIYSPEDFSPVELGDDINSLRFSFSSAFFDNPDQLYYSYLLEGQDDEWSDFSKDFYHEFGRLSPGTYTFKVMARNCAGVKSNVAIFVFKIDYPWYWRWWSISLYSVLLMAIIWYSVKFKTRKLHTENKLLVMKTTEQGTEITRQSEQLRLLSLVASSTTNAIIILDSEGYFNYVNDSFKVIYGYSLQEYKDKFGDNYFVSELLNNKEHFKKIRHAIENMKSESFENCHVMKDEIHRTWVQVAMDPIFSADGKLCNWIICETDISSLKRAEEDSYQQTQMLTEAYLELSERQAQIEYQKIQFMEIHKRLETGYKQLHLQNLTIKESIRYAQNIQNSILPSNDEIAEFLDFFIIYMPKDIVSGDFYIYEKLSNDSFIMIVADCTGHGVPGAFMSIIGHNILYQIIKNENITEPIQILEQLSKRFAESLKQEMDPNADGMEISICKFDRCAEGYDVTFSGTRNSIYFYSKQQSQIFRIRGSKRQMGYMTDIMKTYTFENHKFKLTKDDFLIMLSDGLVDQCNPKRVRFGSQRFTEMVVLNSDLTMRDMGNSIIKSLQDFSDGCDQRDDITVIGLKPKF